MTSLHISTSTSVINLSYSMAGPDPPTVMFGEIAVTMANLKQAVQAMAAIKRHNPDKFDKHVAFLLKNHEDLERKRGATEACKKYDIEVIAHTAPAIPMHRIVLQAAQMAKMVARYNLGFDIIGEMLDERKKCHFYGIGDRQGHLLDRQLEYYHRHLERRFGVQD